MNNDFDEEVAVLIVGGSLVGLSLSIMLASQGIKTMTCERHAYTAIHPRPALFHIRTAEIFRSLGMMETMLEESEKQYTLTAGVFAFESLAGRKLQTFIPDVNAGVSCLSPAYRIFSSQHKMEPLLAAKCEEIGSELRFSTEVTHVEQDDEGCISNIKDRKTGKTTRVKSKYVVACDGGRSPVRKALGINRTGFGEMSRSVTIFFKANVQKYVDQNNGIIYIINDKVRGFCRIDRDGQSGFLGVFTAGEKGAEKSRYPGDNITPAKAKELLLAAIGADIECTVERVMPWSAISENAEHYAQGRIFLAGDAAHIVPPTGGYGGNTGIQDAYNLAWKLALVLDNKAGRELLETYEQERLPTGMFTVGQAYARYVNRSAPELKDDRTPQQISDFWVELGLRYNHSEAIKYGPEGGGEIVEDPGEPTASPGARAPHFWLDEDAKTSIQDVFSHTEYTLLVSHSSSGWYHAGKGLENKLPIKTVLLSHPSFSVIYKVAECGCVLVRPDGVIAWKRDEDDSEKACREVLCGVLNEILLLCSDKSTHTKSKDCVRALNLEKYSA